MTSQLRAILTILLIAAAISSTLLTAAEAARRLPEGQHYGRARSLIMAWVAQLTQGQSPRGPGH
ncbi:hypothetical protein HU200_032386 [Digitaria exilis]|uniref:Uncharacterized protein n=1 Tax=Digitaria exilis TaxID=1010633 RepID=A0A835EPB8_9POAL|nr:hypothetical protein HU200_032386 [Digitaria exilis]